MKLLSALILALNLSCAAYAQQVKLLGEEEEAPSQAKAAVIIPSGDTTTPVQVEAKETVATSTAAPVQAKSAPAKPKKTAAKKPAVVKSTVTAVATPKDLSVTSAPVAAPAKPKAEVKKATVPKAVPIAAPKSEEVKPVEQSVQVVEDQSGFKVNKKHLVLRGETLWGLSGKYYSDPYKWGKIYNANIDSVKNPDLIYPNDELDIPDITEEVKPDVKAEAPVVPEAQPEPEKVVLPSEPVVEEAVIPAVKPVVASVAPVKHIMPKAEKSQGVDPNALSEEMPVDQKEWPTNMMIAPENWTEDGVIVSKEETVEGDMDDSLSFSGETVRIKLAKPAAIKAGDILKSYQKGSDAYDKKGKKIGREMQLSGMLEVVGIEGNIARAKILDAATIVDKGQVVKKK